MRVIQQINNVATVMAMYAAVVRAPEVTVYAGTPKEVKTRNVANLGLVLDGRYPILTNFRDRDFSLKYAKREWLWYLGADPMDDSIAEHATAWAKLKQPDGSYFSNYGQYMFATPEEGLGDHSQFEYVIRCLKADPYTRRASMVLLQPHHLFVDNVDTVCTYAINFGIADSYLNMTVMMRSNDAVWGFTNDAFCFSQLFEFVYQVMSTHLPGLQRGSYTHFTNSMHVYERHYDMLRKIVAQPTGDYRAIDVPRPTPREVVDLIRSRGQEAEGEYTAWLQA